ncbi:MAG: DUF1918 domain-containing protein, partial [Gaiellaceae bacterium]
MLRNKVKELRAGERVAVTARRVGARRRRGEVVEISTEPGHERCRIRWDDGEESVVYPGPDLTIERRRDT